MYKKAKNIKFLHELNVSGSALPQYDEAEEGLTTI